MSTTYLNGTHLVLIPGNNTSGNSTLGTAAAVASIPSVAPTSAENISSANATTSGN